MATPLPHFPSNESLPKPAPLKIPRLTSLLHRVQHAKDADGKPSELLDELMFLLDDPPPGTGDRWQAGADLCAEHGISTSRMSVWRLYRAHILPWRREQNPAPPAPPLNPQDMARLQEQARYLAVQRLLEMLNDPRLTAPQLIGILRGDLRRQHIQLARDQFEHRRRREQVQRDDRIEEQMLRRGLFLAQAQKLQKSAPPSPHVTPRHTS